MNVFYITNHRFIPAAPLGSADRFFNQDKQRFYLLPQLSL